MKIINLFYSNIKKKIGNEKALYTMLVGLTGQDSSHNRGELGNAVKR